MPDIDEIMRRAREKRNKASEQLSNSMEQSRRLAGQTQAARQAGAQSAEAAAGGRQCQVEILGQMFGPDMMEQMVANEALIHQMVNDRISETAALGVEAVMGRLLGEDMGVIAAALETLAMEDEEEDGRELDLDLETELYGLLDEKLTRLESLPEPEPDLYTKGDARWARFGILLSGIISNLNDHQLDGMDVEEHIPVMEQQIASLVRRSWGINGRGQLLDTIRYLTRKGYALRYRRYCEAQSPEELHSWREFAQSYLFGGLMWKLICGDADAESYLGYLSDAAADLLTGQDEDEGQWKDCPWPAARKIGFQL